MIHEKLAHLSREEIDQIVERYTSGEKASLLIAEYKVDVSPSGLVNILPPKVHHDQPCPYCEDQFLEEKVKSPSSYSRQPPKCPSCRHQNLQKCRCQNCLRTAQSRAEQELALKREAIYERYYVDDRPPPAVQDLTFLDTVYLLSLYRHSASEDLREVEPFSDQQPEFAPTFDFQNDIVKHLYAKLLIAPAPYSETDAFDFSDDLADTVAYYPTRINWTILPGVEVEQKRSFISDLNLVAQSHSDWPDAWKDQQITLWRQIAKYEAIEFLHYQMRQRDFQPDNPGPKTHGVIDDLLNRFSVAQIYNLIWGTSKEISDWMVRQNPPKYIVKNSFIGNLERRADKWAANDWEVKPYRRNYDLPQTVLSSTFFNLFSGIGDDAFGLVPPAKASA